MLIRKVPESFHDKRTRRWPRLAGLYKRIIGGSNREKRKIYRIFGESKELEKTRELTDEKAVHFAKQLIHAAASITDQMVLADNHGKIEWNKTYSYFINWCHERVPELVKKKLDQMTL